MNNHKPSYVEYLLCRCVYEMDEASTVHGWQFVEQHNSEQLEAVNNARYHTRLWSRAAAAFCLIPLVVAGVLVSIFMFHIDASTALGVALSAAGILVVGFAFYVWATWPRLFLVDTEKAKCRSEADEDFITSQIQAHGGFGLLDKRVNKLRLASLEHVKKKQMRTIYVQLVCAIAMSTLSAFFLIK